jgi:hypothetical protein
VHNHATPITVNTATASGNQFRVFVWDGTGGNDRLNEALRKIAKPGTTVFGEVFADGKVDVYQNYRVNAGNDEFMFYLTDQVPAGQWIVCKQSDGTVTTATASFASSYYTITGTV